MRRTKNIILCILCLAGTSALVHGQDVDLDKISAAKPIRVSGGVSLLNRFYGAMGIDDRQENHIWTLSGRLNFSIFGIAVPFSGTLTSQNSSVTQPYNRVSLKPTYKWAKAHIGYSNMTYSSYTLAGHTFLGGGLELNPGKIRFAANYGRFASAIPLDRATNQPFVPSFDRFGYGGKIGYGDDSNFIDFTYFAAEDKQDSWGFAIPDSSTVFPGENVVVGSTWKMSLIKNLSISGEIARTIYTEDVRDELISEESLIGVIPYDNRASTVARNAFKTSISYSLLGARVSGNYERIDPGYQTMGAYFFNNDLENITTAVSTAIFGKKLALSVNGGLQRNNLSGEEETESRRTIGAGTVVFAQNPFSVGVNFSNYSSEVRFVLNPSLDSLNAVVVTQSVGLFGTYTLQRGSGDPHVFSANVSRQTVNDDFQSMDRSNESSVVSGTLTYTLKMSSIGTDLTARFNYNRNDLAGVITERLGPGFTLKRNFFQDVVTTQTSVNYFAAEGNNTLNFLLAASATLKKQHVFSLNTSYIRRSIISTMASDGNTETATFGELISTINYSFRF